MRVILVMLLLYGCSGSKELPKDCKETEIEKLVTVNGCDVFDVRTGAFSDMGSCSHSRRFMFTDCRNTTLEWQCSKSSTCTNSIK